MAGRRREDDRRRGDEWDRRYAREEHASRRPDRNERDDRRSRPIDARPGTSHVSAVDVRQVDRRQPEFQIQVVQPAKNDRSGRCAVCIRKVPNYMEHANARHLPWFVHAHTACGACYTQFSNIGLLLTHFEQVHGGRSHLLNPKQWAVCMDELFQMIADALHISSSSIPTFVRERKLAMPGNFRQAAQYVNPDNERYVKEPTLSGREPYNPINVRSLRDCVHWKIIMRLIAGSGGEVGRSLVRSINPRQGYVYYPETPEDRKHQHQNRHLQRPAGLTPGSQPQPAPMRQQGVPPPNPVYPGPSTHTGLSLEEDSLANTIVEAVASGAILPNSLPPDIGELLAELVRVGRGADPSVIRELAARTIGIQAFKDIPFHNLQSEVPHRPVQQRMDHIVIDGPPTSKTPVPRPEDTARDLGLHHDAYGYDPRERRFDNVAQEHHSRREHKDGINHQYAEGASSRNAGIDIYDSRNGRQYPGKESTDRYRELQAAEQHASRYPHDRYPMHETHKNDDVSRHMAEADIRVPEQIAEYGIAPEDLLAYIDLLPPKEFEMYRRELSRERHDRDRYPAEVPRKETPRDTEAEPTHDRPRVEPPERQPAILPTPDPRRSADFRGDEDSRAWQRGEDIAAQQRYPEASPSFKRSVYNKDPALQPDQAAAHRPRPVPPPPRPVPPPAPEVRRSTAVEAYWHGEATHARDVYAETRRIAPAPRPVAPPPGVPPPATRRVRPPVAVATDADAREWRHAVGPYGEPEPIDLDPTVPQRSQLPTPYGKRPPDPATVYAHRPAKRPPLLDERDAIPAKDDTYNSYTVGMDYRMLEEAPPPSRADPGQEPRGPAPIARPPGPSVAPPPAKRPRPEPTSDVRDMRKQLQTLSQGMTVLTDAIMHMNHLNK